VNPAEVRSVSAVDELVEHVAVLKAELPANAYSMREVLDFLAGHPGLSKADLKRALGRIGRNTHGKDSVDRLLRRGMVYNLGPANRYRLYITLAYAAERPVGSYAPGHP
jgi:hypothetical protein